MYLPSVAQWKQGWFVIKTMVIIQEYIRAGKSLAIWLLLNKIVGNGQWQSYMCQSLSDNNKFNFLLNF